MAGTPSSPAELTSPSLPRSASASRVICAFLLIAEPALLLGVAAIVLGRPSALPGFRVLDLMGALVWVCLAIMAPIEMLALQLDREMRRTIAKTRERLAIADGMMDEGYNQAVRAKFSTVHDGQTRMWARIGLEDARSGLRAAERLSAEAPDGEERRRLLGLRVYFAGQIEHSRGTSAGSVGTPDRIPSPVSGEL